MIIGICDDDKSWVQTCKNTLMKFAAFINIDMEIKCFYTTKELLDYQDIPLDAVFLDIELGRQNGIMIAILINTVTFFEKSFTEFNNSIIMLFVI